SRDTDAPSFAFRIFRLRRHPGLATASTVGFQFRGSIPGLYVPLSTLHLRPWGRQCMTRSRCGPLILHRMKLSFTTPCRFLPAHRNSKLSLGALRSDERKSLLAPRQARDEQIGI